MGREWKLPTSKLSTRNGFKCRPQESQKVQLECHFGIGAQNDGMAVFLGPHSRMTLQLDPLMDSRRVQQPADDARTHISQRLHVALWYIHGPQSYDMVTHLRPMYVL